MQIVKIILAVSLLPILSPKSKSQKYVSCSLINFKKKTLTFCYNDMSHPINVLESEACKKKQRPH